MKVSIHQPNYFPYYGYFHKIKNCNIFVFLDNVTFSNNSYINRNRIKTQKGLTWLTVPVVKTNILKTSIKDISISNISDWATKHWNIIDNSYNKSKYFQIYKNFFRSVYDKKWENLCDLNVYTVQKICEILNIDTNFIRASELNVKGSGSDIILNICKELNADIYFSGISGKSYLNELDFKKNNIQIIYQNFEHPVYPQLFGQFISNLSIIDVIFNIEDIF